MVGLKREGRYPNDGPAYTVVTGCDLETTEAFNLAAARLKVQGAMTPPTSEEAESWLVMLQAACPRRPDSEALTTVAYHLYAGALKRFPADVAKAACERLARGKPGKTAWFPSYAELMDMCERLAAPRQIMFQALCDWTPREERTARAPTPEERARVRRMALEFSQQSRKAVGSDYVFAAPPTDEHGLTAEMRAHLAQKGTA